MRSSAFFVVGLISAAYLVALLIVLISMFSGDMPFIYFLAKKTLDWHAWLVVSLAMIIFAAVPLSLIMALVRMISHTERDESARGAQLVTPQIEMLKICLNALKQSGKYSG